MDIREIRRRLVERQSESKELRSGRSRTSRWGRRAVAFLGTVLLLVLLTLVGFRLAAALRETQTAGELAPSGGRFVATGSERFFIQESGPAAGRPVLLVHGTGAWSEFWRDVMQPLAAAGFRVVAVDLPPFGFSDRPLDGAYDRASQARRLEGLIDALGLDRPLLVGHSFGAGPTVETVMRRPAKIGGLVLIAGALGLGEPPAEGPAPLVSAVLAAAQVRDAVVAAVATNPLATRLLLEQMVHRKEAADSRRVAVLQRPLGLARSTHDIGLWLRYFVSPDRAALSADRGNYRRLGVATALIWGDRDALTPLAQAHDLSTLLGGTELHVLPDVGHIPQIEAPEQLSSVLISTLRRLCGAAESGGRAGVPSPC